MKHGQVPKRFSCFPHIKLSLPRSLSKSSSTSCSPKSHNTPKTSPSSSSRSSTEEKLLQVFQRFDSDQDGKISALELRSYFGSIGEYMSYEEAKGVVDELDKDGDKSIDFDDFLRFMKRENEEDDDDVKGAFQAFEFQGSGGITAESLQRMLGRLGDSKTYEECVGIIQVYDIDGNGVLDYYEFHQMMMD